MWDLRAHPAILCLKASGTALCDSTKTLRCLVLASRVGRFKNEKQIHEKNDENKTRTQDAIYPAVF